MFVLDASFFESGYAACGIASAKRSVDFRVWTGGSLKLVSVPSSFTLALENRALSRIPITLPKFDWNLKIDTCTRSRPLQVIGGRASVRIVCWQVDGSINTGVDSP